MSGRILVGYDGSPSATIALDWALRRAEATGLDVDVLFVADTSWDSEGFTATPLLAKQGEVVLADAAFHADSKAPHVTVTSRTLPGNPITVLCAEAESTGAALLVVGCYRKDVYERLTTSAVSVRVAAAATVPVAVIPDLPPVHRRGVVVGIDGSGASSGTSASAGAGVGDGDGESDGDGSGGSAEPDAILAAAVAEARRLDEPLRVITAWTLPPFSTPDFSDDAALYDALEERARSVAETAVERTDTTGVEVATSAVFEAPVNALLHAAADASLLVIGSHGRRGLSRFLLGSVSHDVLVHAPAPVLVLRVTK